MKTIKYIGLVVAVLFTLKAFTQANKTPKGDGKEAEGTEKSETTDPVVKKLEKCTELQLKGCTKVDKINVEIKSKKDLKDEDIKHYLTFSRGETYVITVCSLEENLVISLFDGKDNFIASTYNEETGINAKKVSFKCHSTSKYCLTYFLAKKSKATGVVSVGMKKKEK